MFLKKNLKRSNTLCMNLKAQIIPVPCAIPGTHRSHKNRDSVTTRFTLYMVCIIKNPTNNQRISGEHCRLNIPYIYISNYFINLIYGGFNYWSRCNINLLMFFYLNFGCIIVNLNGKVDLYIYIASRSLKFFRPF